MAAAAAALALGVLLLPNVPAALASSPTQLTAGSGSNQAAQAGSAFAEQFSVIVRDGTGIGVPDVSVTFTAPATGPSGTFAGGKTVTAVMSNASGLAVAPGFTANSTAGSYAVTASLSSSSVTPAYLPVSNTAAPGTQTQQTIVPQIVTTTSAPPKPILPVPQSEISSTAGVTYDAGVIPNPDGPRGDCGDDAAQLIFSNGVQVGGPGETPSVQTTQSPCWWSTFVVNSGHYYSPQEATWIYTTLAQCAGSAPDAGTSGATLWNATTGQMAAGRVLGLPPAEQQAGVVAWVPPACSSWYLEAPLYYQQIDKEIQSSDAAFSVPANVFARIADLNPANQINPRSFLLPFAPGANCQSGCTFDEQNFILTVTPYLATAYNQIQPATDASNVKFEAYQLFQYYQDAFEYIKNGCPGSGEHMVLYPAGQLAAAGSSYPQMGIECISIHCQSIANSLFGSGASFGNWISYLSNAPEYDVNHDLNCVNPEPVVESYLPEAVEVPEDLIGDMGLELIQEGDADAGADQWVIEITDDMVQSTDQDDLGLAGEEGTGDEVFDQLQLTPTTNSQTAGDPRQPMSAAGVTSASANPAVVGVPVTYSFTVPHFDPTHRGTVSFDDMGGGIRGCTSVAINSSGTATCKTTYSQPGGHSIYAGYSGDDANGPTYDQSPLTETVTQDASTTELVSSADPSATGQQVTLTATVAAASSSEDPTGSVDFTDGETDLGHATLSPVPGGGRQAALTVGLSAIGKHAITAAYGGDGDFRPSASKTLIQDVGSSLSSGTTKCTGVYGGTGNSIIVPSGATCTLLSSGDVLNNVTVQAGASLIDQGAEVGGDILANRPQGIGIGNGALVSGSIEITGLAGGGPGAKSDGRSESDSYICNTTVERNVRVQKGAATAGPIDIGDTADCPAGQGNMIGGSLLVEGNQDQVDTTQSHVEDNIEITDNTGGVTATDNVALHNAVCENNTPAVTGQGNTAHNQNTGCPS